MTTSEPRTPHDDTPREHRRLGQRIFDAVLGDPADPRRDDPADTRRGDPADTRRADPDRAEGRTGAAGFASDGPRGEHSSHEQAMREHADGGVVQDDRAAGLGYAAPTKDPGDMVADVDEGRAGYADRGDAHRDAGYDAGDTRSDARRDAGQAGHAGRNDAVRDAGEAAYDGRRDAGDARRDAAQPGYADQRATDRADTAEAPWDSGYDQPGTRAGTAPGAAHDLPRPGAGTAGDDRDLVTSSYDPDRDTSYDPQAAGTAMDSAAGAGAASVADRDARFSAVDDTATVDSSETGRSSAEAAVAGDGRGDAGVADDDGSGTRERLVPDERAEDYGSRWDALKGDFVDEPRRAVRQADELVGELLDELQRLFADQRRNLEQGFDHDQASTEDLRLALRRYRSFFDRLLSF